VPEGAAERDVEIPSRIPKEFRSSRPRSHRWRVQRPQPDARCPVDKGSSAGRSRSGVCSVIIQWIEHTYSRRSGQPRLGRCARTRV